MNRVYDIVAESQEYYRINKKRILILGITVLILTLALSVGFISKTVAAKRSEDRVKLITSIEVKKGDTLWSIASEYISDEYDNIIDYIEEIKKCNRMTSDDIHTGNYLIIPYYTDASR